jgi:DNA ligase-1
VLLADLVATSEAVTATRSRRAKIAALAACLQQAEADEVAIAASYLAGTIRQERLDVGWQTVKGLSCPATDEPRLTLTEVHDTLNAVAAAKGSGSRKAKTDALERLLTAATDTEQRFLTGLILGELRQGALEGIIAQGIAEAWGVPASAVQRAWMLSGDLGVTAQAVAEGGEEALGAFSLTLFRPVHPMLAQTSETAGEAVTRLGRALVDYKLDGARIQVHRDGDSVAVYTRNLRDVTARLPEVVAVTRSLPVTSVVLDGEVIGVQSDGRPHPFQETMARFGSDVGEDAPPGVVMVPVFFDCMYIDGRDLLDDPLEQRREHLHRVVPSEHRVLGEIVTQAEAADAVFEQALAAGHEGVVVKDLASAYAAGRRGGAWQKVKPSDTLDLVVLGVEWGSGRRKGWLSNLHLGARTQDGEFVMLGKTFKGMTDAMLEWQTKRLLELETHREGHVVYVRPELVVEIAIDGVQTSTRYPGGVALRFARVKGYREDKPAEEADTLERVQAIRDGKRG